MWIDLLRPLHSVTKSILSLINQYACTIYKVQYVLVSIQCNAANRWHPMLRLTGLWNIHV